MVQKKVRIEDVARKAGVSITTVSRVINKVPTVSKPNREKVEEVIRQLKFKPNISAQRLARGINNTIALVIPRYEGIFHSFYAIELIRGIGSACEALKLDLLLHITNAKDTLNTSNIGGVIFADIIGNRKQLEDTLDEKVPCFVINNRVSDLDVNFISIDNTKGAFLAVDYLISLGHKNIATITGDLITQVAQERLDGYKQALQKKGLTIKQEYILKGDYSRRSSRVATKQLLELSSPPTAIFAASDDMALEAIAVIIEEGLKVPEDISIIGFDDNPSSLYGAVTLTTIRQPLFAMAGQAVKDLNALISGKKKSPVKLVLPTELVVRESCSHI